ncbi:1460_t:CDS:2 [Diversispora eburnea]|uniref:1460_t:CDS:1 n=1 Tax=Diversispora eburnea TaxID=1213867 RepID=A0A9N9FX98_9GLOM|nr:1460_t:CDS:2 [Diversispora eburnea]
MHNKSALAKSVLTGGFCLETKTLITFIGMLLGKNKVEYIKRDEINDDVCSKLNFSTVLSGAKLFGFYDPLKPLENNSSVILLSITSTDLYFDRSLNLITENVKTYGLDGAPQNGYNVSFDSLFKQLKEPKTKFKKIDLELD